MNTLKAEVDNDLRDFLLEWLIKHGETGVVVYVEQGIGDPVMWAHAMDRGYLAGGIVTEAGHEFIRNTG